MKTEAETKDRQPGKSAVRRGIFLGAALAVIGAAVTAWMGMTSEVPDYGPVAEAKRGDLTISVNESGTLRSRDQVVITNRIKGRTTIIWVVPEGTVVEEGDLLAEFDSSKLENDLVESRIEVQNAEATFIRAREQLAVTKSQNESDIAAAELTLRLARLDLARYLGDQEALAGAGIELENPVGEAEGGGSESDLAADGEYAQAREKLISEIELAREELIRAQQQYEDSVALAQQEFITELEVEGDRLAMERARVAVKLAEGQLRLLETYTHRRDLEQLRSDVEQAERALDRVKLTANANLVQAQADFDSARQKLEEEKRELAEIEQQLSYTKIRAPAAGMVVYETSANQRRWGNNEPLQAGQEISERQELIYLPSSEGMVADISVHESSLDRISVGMPARITVDARPGTYFEGRVRKIAPMPDAQSVWLNPDLTVYKTEVEIDTGTHSLRTGMSCRVEVVIDELKDVVYVPLQAVIKYNDQHYVYLLPEKGGPPVARPVEIGYDNNRMVHIRSGLEPGERVLLAPPLYDRMENDKPMEETVPEDESGDEAPAAEEHVAGSETAGADRSAHAE